MSKDVENTYRNFLVMLLVAVVLLLGCWWMSLDTKERSTIRAEETRIMTTKVISTIVYTNMPGRNTESKLMDQKFCEYLTKYNFDDRNKSPAGAAMIITCHPITSRVDPWEVAEKVYFAYAKKYGRGQSLERLAQRGGFYEGELDQLYPTWRTETSQYEQLEQKCIKLRMNLDRRDAFIVNNGYWLSFLDTLPRKPEEENPVKDGTSIIEQLILEKMSAEISDGMKKEQDAILESLLPIVQALLDKDVTKAEVLSSQLPSNVIKFIEDKNGSS